MSTEALYPEALQWNAAAGVVRVLDQTLLPEEEVWVGIETAAAMAEAIRTLKVRGAPATGIAAAVGLVQDLSRRAGSDMQGLRRSFDAAEALLRSTRPTAVNLFHALDRMRGRLESEALSDAGASQVLDGLREEAAAILEEDRLACRRIAEFGISLLSPDPAGERPEIRVMTHCNAGALATGGMGTALAPIYLAHARNWDVQVFVGETRPLFQGSRLTAWELERAGIPVTVFPDNGAAVVLARKEIDHVIVGADRIAANGDVANKLGSYGLAALAKLHDVPFMVAAPLSTIDPSTPTGAEVPIEHRHPDEVRRAGCRYVAPPTVPVFAPAFDVVPQRLITAIVTDAGVLRPPYDKAISTLPASGGAG